jgi:hypothetical protein
MGVKKAAGGAWVVAIRDSQVVKRIRAENHGDEPTLKMIEAAPDRPGVFNRRVPRRVLRRIMDIPETTGTPGQARVAGPRQAATETWRSRRNSMRLRILALHHSPASRLQIDVILRQTPNDVNPGPNGSAHISKVSRAAGL